MLCKHPWGAGRTHLRVMTACGWRGKERSQRASALWNQFQFTRFSFLPRSVKLSVAFITGILIGMLFNCIKDCFWYFLPCKKWPFEKMKIVAKFKITFWLKLGKFSRGPCWSRGFGQMTCRDPCQPQPFCDFVKASLQFHCSYSLYLRIKPKWIFEHVFGKRIHC